MTDQLSKIPQDQDSRKTSMTENLPTLLILLGILGVWILLQAVILPRMGVPT
jgi:hypothetical protein